MRLSGDARERPLSVEGRRRLVERCRPVPIAQAAAEAGVSRASATNVVAGNN
ncbi:hypothetical protein [Streptomyces abikoensis]|uniref:Transposase n=1 Tax=Streptomyces abikoensis TaxID=97398 RepID=A0ABW7TBR8_9ACTN